LTPCSTSHQQKETIEPQQL
jgi:hypothetical protein